MKTAFLLDASGIFHIMWANGQNAIRAVQGHYTDLDSQSVVTAASNRLRDYLAQIAQEIEQIGLQDEIKYFGALDTGKTWRHELYPDYKGKRAKRGQNQIRFLTQVAPKILQDSGCQLLQAIGYEADDIIAVSARRLAANGWDVRIISNDKDLLQLVDQNIKMVYRHREKGKPTKTLVMGLAEAKEFLGFHPNRLPLFKAIAGDGSDNIPGMPSIGEKGALPLVREFADTTTLLASLHTLLPKHQKVIEANKSKLELYERLTRLGEIGAINIERVVL